jgi:RNA polymerase-binding transcription factor DksA
MTTMSKTTRLTRSQLRDLEQELQYERTKLERLMVAEDGSSDAPSYNGTVMLDPGNPEGGLATALETQTLSRYEAIVRALERMADGSYGTCLACDKPIPFGRLLAMPETTRCVGCGPRG